MHSARCTPWPTRGRFDHRLRGGPPADRSGPDLRVALVLSASPAYPGVVVGMTTGDEVGVSGPMSYPDDAAWIAAAGAPRADVSSPDANGWTTAFPDANPLVEELIAVDE